MRQEPRAEHLNLYWAVCYREKKQKKKDNVHKTKRQTRADESGWGGGRLEEEVEGEKEMKCKWWEGLPLQAS